MGEKGIVSNVEKMRVLSDLISRARLSSLMGVTFSGNRDLFTVLGYRKTLAFQDYWDTYRRGRLSKRVINAPVDATWFGDVSIFETQEPNETPFEMAWQELDEKFKIISKLVRLDKLVGLGEYAILVIGVDDGKPLDQPLDTTNRKLLYLQPYHQGNASIVRFEEDQRNERYGLPIMYSIRLRRPGLSLSLDKETLVHWTRVLHVADGCLENDIWGIPRLESIYNGLTDLDKLAGGSAEMFWQGALGGKAFTTQEGATLDATTMEEMGEEIDEYIHGLRRFLRLQNIDVQDLAPSITGPKDHVDVQLDLIAGDTGIPKRILIGSERGELASTQDESNWLSRIEQRRIHFAEPEIIRPLIDIFIKLGILPEPKEGYQVDWPDLWSQSDKEQAEVSKIRTEAIAAYIGAPGIEMIMPEMFFFEEILGLTPEQIERLEKMLSENPTGPLLEREDEKAEENRIAKEEAMKQKQMDMEQLKKAAQVPNKLPVKGGK